MPILRKFFFASICMYVYVLVYVNYQYLENHSTDFHRIKLILFVSKKKPLPIYWPLTFSQTNLGIPVFNFSCEAFYSTSFEFRRFLRKNFSEFRNTNTMSVKRN